jgi:hypothetical protein
MKNITTAFLIFLISFCYAQQEVSYQMNTTATKEETLKYSEIKGSPYLNDSFSPAKATCCNEIMPMRYDTYTDEIEYKKEGTVYTLLKESPYTKIEFTSPKVVLTLEDIDHKPGYFILLADGKNSLLKKITTKIESPSGNKNPVSFASKDTNSNFRRDEPIYYVKTEKGTYKLLKNKKDILDLYPDKTTELNSFFDSNKIKFNKEESLIKLVNFLNK